MSGLSEIKIPWLSLDQAAEPLALLLGLKTFTANEVLDLFTNNQVMASVCIKSSHLFAWPLVKLIGQDAEQFRQDEQRTETYRGSSFTIKGECMAPNREDTRLVSGRVLDLPLSTATRNFLQRLQDNPVPAGKRLRLPRGTLVQVPDTGQYFVTMDTLEVPDVFCEIVVRTESLRELERQIKALEIEPLAPPVVAPKRRARKPSIEAVALDYMRTEYKKNQCFQSAAAFHKYLIKTAGVDGSPFVMGTGKDGGRLFCSAASSFYDEGTLGKLWPKIRAV